MDEPEGPDAPVVVPIEDAIEEATPEHGGFGATVAKLKP